VAKGVVRSGVVVRHEQAPGDPDPAIAVDGLLEPLDLRRQVVVQLDQVHELSRLMVSPGFG
jgi:hypothetical protein